MGRAALDWIDGELEALAVKGLRRALEPLGSAQGPVVTVDGRPLVNLCSNDYLGLASDPRLVRAASAAAELHGAGSGAAGAAAGSGAGCANARVPASTTIETSAMRASDMPDHRTAFARPS